MFCHAKQKPTWLFWILSGHEIYCLIRQRQSLKFDVALLFFPQKMPFSFSNIRNFTIASYEFLVYKSSIPLHNYSQFPTRVTHAWEKYGQESRKLNEKNQSLINIDLEIMSWIRLLRFYLFFYSLDWSKSFTEWFWALNFHFNYTWNNYLRYNISRLIRSGVHAFVSFSFCTIVLYFLFGCFAFARVMQSSHKSIEKHTRTVEPINMHI